MKVRPEYLGSVNAKAVGKAAMTVFDRLQEVHPDIQVAAVGVVFTALLRQHRIEDRRVHEIARNLLDDASRYTPELRAVNSYIREEL